MLWVKWTKMQVQVGKTIYSYIVLNATSSFSIELYIWVVLDLNHSPKSTVSTNFWDFCDTWKFVEGDSLF